MAAIIGGVILLVIGLNLSGTILTTAATSGSSANIGSFSGASAMNDLIPLLYYTLLVIVSVGLMAVGGFSAQRRVRGG